MKDARAGAGYKNPTEAARAHRDINLNTLISQENGNRALSRMAAEKYARLFGVRAGWLLYGEDEEPRNEVEVPILSMVSAGRLREQMAVTESDIDRRLKIADLPKGEWIGLVVEGDSMDRIAPEGATILVNRADDKLLDGRYYIFSLEGGAATFKRYRREPERLQPFSTNPDHTSFRVENGELYVFGRVRRVIHDI